MLTPTAASVVDLHGLAELRAAAARGDDAALEEAAMQFEALFVGMMLKSARDASLGEGLLDGPETKQYLEMMDRQVALDIARRGGVGFGQMLVEQLGGGAAQSAKESATGSATATSSINGAASSSAFAVTASDFSRAARLPAAGAASSRAGSAIHGVVAPLERLDDDDARVYGSDGVRARSAPVDRDRFVRELMPHAQRIAERLGIDPRVLIAQAALETGWGASVPRRPDGRSSHNLFGIKAGDSWQGSRAPAWTLENVEGVAERRRTEFRAYRSAAESFDDYAAVIERLPRYADALAAGGDAEQYVRAVADAGYATDPRYAEKWLAVYRSDPIAGAAAKESGAGADIVASATGRHDAGVLGSRLLPSRTN